MLVLSEQPDSGLPDPRALDTPLPRERSVVVVLDARCHGQKALARLDRWRQRGERVQVLVVTDRHQIEQRQQALELGASDFLIAPVDELELELRIGKLVGTEPEPPASLQLTDCVVTLANRRVSRVGGSERLTPTEAKLLSYLAARPGQTVDHTTLLREVWGYREGVRTRTLAVTVQRLRGKIEAVADEPVHVLTAYGTGYRFEPLRTTKKRTNRTLSWPSLLDSQRTNLAPARLRWRGREADVHALALRLDGQSHVRIVGQPGSGRGRLAQQVLATHSRRLAGGAWWIPGHAGMSAQDWLGAMSSRFGLTPGDGLSWDRLAWALHARGPTWLALQEPGLDAVGDGLELCLGRAPDLRVITTGPASADGGDAHVVVALREGDAAALLISAARGASPDLELRADLPGLRDLAVALERRPAWLSVVGPLLGSLGPRDLLRMLDGSSPLELAWRMTAEPVRAVVERVYHLGPSAPVSSLGEAVAHLDAALCRGWLVSTEDLGGHRSVGVCGAARPFLAGLMGEARASVEQGPAHTAAVARQRLADGHASLEAGRAKEARRHLVHALETFALQGLRDDYVRASIALAEAHSRLDHLDDARAVLISAVEGVDDGDLSMAERAELFRALARVHVQGGLAEAAAEALAAARTRFEGDDDALERAIGRLREREA